MSPVWVKLGDFGVSKRILAQATTTFHTQVSTPMYSAPEVLGLDSGSETSDYTNSVDIWSLGCVIYELLVGTKLFASEGQVSRYYFGKWPFPEDTLKGLSPPTDDLGISLLKSMLIIQPEDRPTASSALSHGWLAELKSVSEDSGGEEATNRRCKNTLATQERQERGGDERNPITEDHRGCISGGVALGEDVGSQIGGDTSTPKTRITTYLVTVPVSDAASAESLAVRTRHRKLRPTSHNFQAPYSEAPMAPRKKQIPDIQPTCPQSKTPNTNFNLHIKPVANCD